jgi:hypothetical protein
LVIGPASFATGHAVATTWRHWGQVVFYTALLSAALRFLDYALGGGEFFPAIMPPGYHIACSDSHATVACGGHIVHDPHPRKSGLREITEWILLMPMAREGQR